MAYKLGLNREPQRPLPADLQYAREILVSLQLFDASAHFAVSQMYRPIEWGEDIPAACLL